MRRYDTRMLPLDLCWLLVLMYMLLLATGVVGCARPNVQLVPKGYQVSQQWQRLGCSAEESVVIAGQKLASLRCQDGLRLVDYKDQTLHTFVGWKEMR